MVIDSITVGGEVISYFNVLKEVTYLRDVFFDFISGWATPFLTIIVVIWVMIFLSILIKNFMDRVKNGI